MSDRHIAANKRRDSWQHMKGKQSGPRTPDGKRRSAMRSLTYGGRTSEAEAIRAWTASLIRLSHSAQNS